MDSLSHFPCQDGNSSSQASKLWDKYDLTVDLGMRHEAQTSSNIRTFIDLAFAASIWAHTGDNEIKFLSCSRNKHLLEHAVRSSKIRTDMTVREALASVSASPLAASDDKLTAPNAILHINTDCHTGGEDGLSRPLESVPLQVLWQADTSNTHIKLRLWFDQSSVSKFHAHKHGKHLFRVIKWILKADMDESMTRFVTLAPEDATFIRSFNSTPQQRDFRTIQSCVAEVAKRDPGRIAVEAWDGALTRRQLEENSNQLAKTLAKAGVKRGCVVAVIMDKSMWAPVALLAILKAGGAFLLLEPTLPYERLQIMTQVTSTSHAVVSHEHSSLACSLVANVVTGDGHGDFDIVGEGGEPQNSEQIEDAPEVTPLDTAFLTFTSGSSGIPKAIVTQHFAWVTGQTKHVQKFGITEGTRVFQYASYSFVVSILDTLSTLLVGGVVCIPSADERLNDLDNAIRRMRAEYICMTPSVAKVLTPARVPSLRTVVLVGESIPRSVADAWLETGKITLRNGYGQSEACSMNSTATLTKSTLSCRNIGKSTWLRYWVVDPSNHDRLMPVGGLGELLVEGYSVAQGYLGEPEKTAAAFIDSPAWAASFDAGLGGRRWYKTGDLVQYQENGDLFLYGRKDAQLKIHGQRVEAAEIEHHILKAFPGEILQVVVDKVKDMRTLDAESIVAFVTLSAIRRDSSQGIAEQHDDMMEQELRKKMVDRLQDKVPLWMIPKNISIVPTMPRTATGKLDRRSLTISYSAKLAKVEDLPEQHVQADVETSDCKSWPSVATEPTFKQLRAIWSRILNINEEKITPDSQWVDLGGDSLAAMVFVRDARKAGCYLSSADIMSGTPLLGLCENSQVAAKTARSSMECDGEIGETSHEDHNPVTDFQSQYLSRADLPTRGMVYKYQISIRGNFNDMKLQTVLHQWFKGTEAMRLTFSHQPERRTTTQHVISPDSKEWHGRIRQHKADEELASISEKHDFVMHPVLVSVNRSSSIRLNMSQFALHIQHSVFDGLSFNLMLNDLVSICQNGSLASRPSFLDYLNRRLMRRSPSSFEYWQHLLRDSSPTTLRVDSKSPLDVTTYTDVNAEHVVSRIVNLESGICDKNTASMSTLVQSAWSIVLSAISGEMDILFLYLMHGRDENVTDSDKIIGCCVSECPLRVHLRESMSVADLTGFVQQQVLSSAPHAHLGSNTIAANCTDWPSKETTYQHSSFVLHQTVPANSNFSLGDAGYLNVSKADVEHDLTYDFDLASRSCGAKGLSFELRCLQRFYTASEAHAVADAFAASLRTLVSGQGTVGDFLQNSATILQGKLVGSRRE